MVAGATGLFVVLAYGVESYRRVYLNPTLIPAIAKWCSMEKTTCHVDLDRLEFGGWDRVRFVKVGAASTPAARAGIRGFYPFGAYDWIVFSREGEVVLVECMPVESEQAKGGYLYFDPVEMPASGVYEFARGEAKFIATLEDGPPGVWFRGRIRLASDPAEP